jgi:hypothetical protein
MALAQATEYAVQLLGILDAGVAAAEAGTRAEPLLEVRWRLRLAPDGGCVQAHLCTMRQACSVRDGLRRGRPSLMPSNMQHPHWGRNRNMCGLLSWVCAIAWLHSQFRGSVLCMHATPLCVAACSLDTWMLPGIRAH